MKEHHHHHLKGTVFSRRESDLIQNAKHADKKAERAIGSPHHQRKKIFG